MIASVLSSKPSDRSVVIVASSIEAPHLSHPFFDLASFDAQQQNTSPYASSPVSDATLLGDQHQTTSASPNRSAEHSPRPTKRLKAAGRVSQLRDTAQVAVNGELMAVPDANDTATLVEDAVAAARPKRVRTGCLTCRERHLKCDEGLPHCQNCRKSSRVCKRGVRLNFIDTQVQKPPYMPLSHEWSIDFKDESREIAAEYKGGLGRYSALRTEEIAQMKEEAQFEMSQNMVVAPTMSHQQLPPIHALPAEVEMNSYPEPHQNIPDQSRESHHHHTHSNADSTYSSTLHASTQSTFSNSDQILTPPNEARDWLNQPEEVLFMQVFVEEVGSWMDSMDPHKHV